jgi:hypothetical protein
MQNQLNSIEKDVREMKAAFLGDKYGNKGFIKRVERIEEKTAANRKDLNAIKQKSVLLGTGAGGLILGVVEAIKHFFAHG